MADDNPEIQKEQQIGDRFNELMTGRMARHGQYVAATTAALRARGQLIQEEVARERFAMQQQEQELNRIKTIAEISKQRVALQQQMTEQQHVQNAVTALGALDPSDPDYTKKMAQVFNENPMATKDPVVQDIVRSHLSTRQTIEKTGNTLYELGEEEKIKNQSELDKEKSLEGVRAETAGAEEAARIKARIGGREDSVPVGILEQHTKNLGLIAANQESFKSAAEKDKPELISKYKQYVAENDALTDQYPALKNKASTVATAEPSTPIISGSFNPATGLIEDVK